MSARLTRYGSCFPTKMTELGLAIIVGNDTMYVKLPAMKWSNWAYDNSYFENKDIFVYCRDEHDNILILRNDGTGSVYNKGFGLLQNLDFKFPSKLKDIKEVYKGTMVDTRGSVFDVSITDFSDYVVVSRVGNYANKGVSFIVSGRQRRYVMDALDIPNYKYPEFTDVSEGIGDDRNITLVIDDTIPSIKFSTKYVLNGREVELM